MNDVGEQAEHDGETGADAPPTEVGEAGLKRIMLVVPGRLFRNGIELVLRGAGCDIAGECETLDDAEAMLDARPDLEPDLFVVGMRDPERFGEDFARTAALRDRAPASRLVVLSSHGGRELWWQAVEHRVDGLLHQDSPGEVLQLLVRLILLGYSFLPGGPPGSLEGGGAPIGPNPVGPNPSGSNAGTGGAAEPLGRVFALGDALPPAAPRWRAGLSDRETDILRGLVMGHPNKTIARELNISEATVKVHVKALLRKMQVTNRTQAAISAIGVLGCSAAPKDPRGRG